MKDLETQLRQDAETLRSAKSESADASLRRAIAAEQHATHTRAPLAPRWLAWSLPIAVAAAAAWFLIGTPTTSEVQEPAIPQIANSDVPTTLPTDTLSLEQVSSTAPLEAEWEALLSDLERARDQIEQELRTEF
ncbi:MAG: hypothetical protein AAFN07_03355 [Pseudomonadota bacterium]